MPHRPLTPAGLLFLAVLDFALLAIAWCAAYLAVLGFTIPSEAEADYVSQLLILLPWVALSGAVLLTLARTRRFGLPPSAAAIGQVLLPILGVSLIWGAFAAWVKGQEIFLQLPLNETAELVLPLPGGVVALFCLFGILLVGAVRGAGYLTAPKGPAPGDAQPSPAVLVGSGPLARLVASDLAGLARPAWRLLAAVSPESERTGAAVAGLRVAGRLEMLPQMLGETSATAVLVVQDEHEPALLREVVRRCEDFPVRLLMAEPTAASSADLRPVRLQDLIARRPVALHAPAERGPFRGERLLITNADTPAGLEFAWQAARGFPALMILHGSSEDALARCALRIRREHPSLPVETVLAGIQDPDSFDAAVRPLEPTALIHAFPLHRVDYAERFPAHAIELTVLGTATVAELARDLKFHRTVFLSSVKAVYPVGVLGACLRLTEQIAWRLGRDVEHSVQVVRLPTLVGGGFSALEVFEDQARNGKSLTISHPDATRLYLGVEEAVDRALQALSAHAGNGRLFLVDPGDPVRVADLARAAASLAGKRPGKDLTITYTGIGPGEKLREEISTRGEELLPTEVSGVLMVQPREVPDRDRLFDGMAGLGEMIPHASREELLLALRELVPEFHPADLPEREDSEAFLSDKFSPAGTEQATAESDDQDWPGEMEPSEQEAPDFEHYEAEADESANQPGIETQSDIEDEELEPLALGQASDQEERPLKITRRPVIFMDLEEGQAAEEGAAKEEAGEEILEESHSPELEPEEAVQPLTSSPAATEEHAPGMETSSAAVPETEQEFLFPDWLLEDDVTPAAPDSATPEPVDQEKSPDLVESSTPSSPQKEDQMNEQFAELKSRGKLEVKPLSPLPAEADIVLLVFMEGLSAARQREVLEHAEERFPDDVHFLFAGLHPDAPIPASLDERARGLDPSIPAGAKLWNAALEASPENALLLSFPPRVEFHAGFFKTLRDFAAQHRESVLFYADHIERKGDKETEVRVHDHNGCPHERFEFGPVIIYRTAALNAIGGFDESLVHAWEYDAHLKLMVEGYFTRIPGPLYTANEEVVDSQSSALHSPGRGPLGGFSYVFYPEDMDREVTMVFERALRKVGAWINHDTVPVPQPATKPEVMASVVIPVLNRVKYIGNAIDKVREGTFQDFEVIVVDNGSTDGTWELLEEYTKRDPRIRLLRGKGSTIASALNEAIRASRGKYICQLDSDDQYAPTTLEKMIGHLESHPKCGLAISYYRLMDETGKVIDDVAPITHSGYSRNQILRRDGAGAVRIFPKSVLEEFGLYDEEHYGNFGEDYDMVLKTGEKYDVDRVHEVLYFYRRHSDNTDVIRDPEMKYHNKNRARQMALRRRMKINEELGKL
jgi:FlaA1/EpsC-like NDP-sugar epimerase/GT2 family glycosyltransferase